MGTELNMDDTYQLIDSGGFKRLERFGNITIQRPCLSACWKPRLSEKQWATQSDASFARLPSMEWKQAKPLPEEWQVRLKGLEFLLKKTDFGHLGIFPEHSMFWPWLSEICQTPKPLKVLNLFAYSGGATLACAKGGAQVTHIDASKGMIAWARKNAALNRLDAHPIRWIAEDAIAFLKREIKRGQSYQGVILDPPSYGRGKKGETFKIEESLVPLLSLVAQVLKDPQFVLLSCHTPGITPQCLQNLLCQQTFAAKGNCDSGEMFIESTFDAFNLPLGAYARWQAS